MESLYKDDVKYGFLNDYKSWVFFKKIIPFKMDMMQKKMFLWYIYSSYGSSLRFSKFHDLL